MYTAGIVLIVISGVFIVVGIILIILVCVIGANSKTTPCCEYIFNNSTENFKLSLWWIKQKLSQKRVLSLQSHLDRFIEIVSNITS